MTSSPDRRRLPNRRQSAACQLKHNGFDYIVTAGFAPDATVAEVFIDTSKPGSPVANLGQDVAVLISIALQYGVPLDVMRAAMGRDHDGGAHSIAGAAIDLIANL